ncbi:hypothetical protein QYE76_047566 [Lolium multiflorum]|uniref:Reverse transcriptase Ty1/copia-type domain-containing protein n=1 Tax=Lolium multiflorum TaxID=4521 RepID=A0AAD8X235_LOLMU|nr:hypothetical protein QYE76_047566 [Lolium multiflorum]
MLSLLPLLLMTCLLQMSFPLPGLFVSVVLQFVTLLVMVSPSFPSRFLIGMPSVILNGSLPWLRRSLRLSALALGILFLPLLVFVPSRAPRAWFERFASVVTAAGFSPSLHDPALFVHTSPRGRTLLLLYVDDMIITGDDPEYIAFVKARLRDQFLMTDLGPLRYFLGIEVSSTSDGFSISQEKYIQDLLARAALGDERTDTPMELNVKLRPTNGDPLPDPTRYRHLVGSLVYLVVTRPDISYPVHILSQFVSAPTTVHYSHLLRVLRYLRGTITRRLSFPVPALSSSSAIRMLHFGVSVTTPTPLLSDSTGAISIARDPVKHELTKHIGVDAFYTRAQAVTTGERSEQYLMKRANRSWQDNHQPKLLKQRKMEWDLHHDHASAWPRGGGAQAGAGGERVGLGAHSTAGWGVGRGASFRRLGVLRACALTISRPTMRPSSAAMWPSWRATPGLWPDVDFWSRLFYLKSQMTSRAARGPRRRALHPIPAGSLFPEDSDRRPG